MKLVLVYLGDRLPPYVLDSMRCLRQNFPSRDLYFIGDSRQTLALAARVGATTWPYRATEKDRAFLRAAITYDQRFRQGFWINTISRLWAIRDFLQCYPDGPVLHVEADVWLAPDFPLERFEQLSEDLAFPMINDREGVASVLFVRNLASAEALLELAREMASAGDILTDMQLLGRASRSTHLAVRILPTSPRPDVAFYDDVPEPARIKMAGGSDLFGGVFDAATWGQYWLGLDPRNHGGRRLLFRDIPSHFLDCRQPRLQLAEGGGLNLSSQGQEWKLFNLHVHSKDRRAFRDMRSLLELRIQQEDRGVTQEWDLHALARRIANAPGAKAMRVVNAGRRIAMRSRDQKE